MSYEDVLRSTGQGPAAGEPRSARVSRRRFLRYTAAGAAGLGFTSLLAACAPAAAPSPTAAPAKPAESKPGEAAKPAQAAPAFAGGGSLKFLSNAHFIPAYDTWLDQWAADWGAKNKVNVEVDHLLTAEFPAKVAAEVASGDGHDIIRLPRTGDANLYDRYLVDVSDIAKPIGDANGGWIKPVTESIAVVNGAWKVLPDHFTSFDGMYRKDLFEANGLKAPETWDDVLKAGALLKPKGNPIGISINQKSVDSLNSWSSVLWGYGASVVGEDSKTVTINSPETRQALELAIELYHTAMTDEVLSWDESSNNQMLASGRASWIHNPISALRTIEKSTPDLAEKIWLTLSPGGPKARIYTSSGFSEGIMSWSKNIGAAKAFLVDYFNAFGDAVKASEGYNQPFLVNWRKKPMPFLGDSPKYSVDQDASDYYRASGYPGKPTQAAGEVEANWIVPLMVARAVGDRNVNAAIEWAEQKIQTIYDKYK
jgi:multiple sugar transport system substrate-binding protein